MVSHKTVAQERLQVIKALLNIIMAGLTTEFFVGAIGNVGLWNLELQRASEQVRERERLNETYKREHSGFYLDPTGAASGGAEYIAAALLMAAIHCCKSVIPLHKQR